MENDNGTNVLVLDEDGELRGLLQRYLTEQGYTVRAVADSGQLDRLFQRESFDILVLNRMMPGEDGLSVCRRLRTMGETLPIIMLTARGDTVDRIGGLEIGADDYLAKPFSPRELLVRIQASLRRQAMLGVNLQAARSETVAFGPFTLDLTRRELRHGDSLVDLSADEFELLRMLATHANRPLGRERLIELARGQDDDVTSRSIDAQILRLRTQIESDPANPRYIQTVRGVGYVLVVPPKLS